MSEAGWDLFNILEMSVDHYQSEFEILKESALLKHHSKLLHCSFAEPSSRHGLFRPLCPSSNLREWDEVVLCLLA